MPWIIEIYGATSKRVESFIDKVVEKATEINALILSYWWKPICTTTLQYYNARLIN